MPLIDLKCKVCGSVTEVLTTVAHSKVCPDCGGETEKVFAPSSFGSLVLSNGTSEAAIAELGGPSAFLAQKAWIESPESQQKIRDGRMVIQPKGPREFQPETPKTCF
jgi:putative FmdB family regulatory protein